MKMFKYKSMGGLRVEGGRLVNDREDGVTGIAKAASVKKMMKRAKKVDMIADGISLAEAKKVFYRM
jgi:hypothetical protein